MILQIRLHFLILYCLLMILQFYSQVLTLLARYQWLIGSYHWFKANKLSVNATKTNYMIMGTRHMTSNEDKSVSNVDIILDKTKLKRVDKTKFLGVTIDEKFIMEKSHWWYNINQIVACFSNLINFAGICYACWTSCVISFLMMYLDLLTINNVCRLLQEAISISISRSRWDRRGRHLAYINIARTYFCSFFFRITTIRWVSCPIE